MYSSEPFTSHRNTPLTHPLHTPYAPLYPPRTLLQVLFEVERSERKPTKGHIVRVHYTGILPPQLGINPRGESAGGMGGMDGMDGGRGGSGGDTARSNMSNASRSSRASGRGRKGGKRGMQMLQDGSVGGSMGGPGGGGLSVGGAFGNQAGEVAIRPSSPPQDIIFENSRERGRAFQFKLGVGQVIPGWDRAIMKMRKGERARIKLDPELGYGPKGQPPLIPPNARLVFEIELIDFFYPDIDSF